MNDRRRQEQQERRSADAGAWAQRNESGYEPTAVKLPDGFRFFTTKNIKTYRLDVIPFVAGKGNKDADEGYDTFQRSYFAHRGLGIDGRSSYVCLRTFDERCPVCEWISKYGGSADPELVKALKQQLRHLWCVIDLDDKDKGVQVWDTPHYKSFGEMMKEKLKAVEAYRDFWRPDDRGMTLLVSVEEFKIGTNKYNGVKNVEIVQRKHTYPKDIADRSPCLDNCLLRLSYDELRAVMDMDKDDKNSGARDAPPERRHERGAPVSSGVSREQPNGHRDAPVREARPAVTDQSDDKEDDFDVGAIVSFDRKGRTLTGKITKISRRSNCAEVYVSDVDDNFTVSLGDLSAPTFDVGDTVYHHKYKECTIVKMARDGATVTLEDDSGEVHVDVAVDELELSAGAESETQPSPPPVETAKRASAPSTRRGRELEDDDEIDDDPPPRSRRGR